VRIVKSSRCKITHLGKKNKAPEMKNDNKNLPAGWCLDTCQMPVKINIKHHMVQILITIELPTIPSYQKPPIHRKEEKTKDPDEVNIWKECQVRQYDEETEERGRNEKRKRKMAKRKKKRCKKRCRKRKRIKIRTICNKDFWNPGSARHI
jgi:hypothetical protein